MKIALAALLAVGACRYCYLMGMQVESKRDAIRFMQRLDLLEIKPTPEAAANGGNESAAEAGEAPEAAVMS
jgi:hypothetical protein